MSKAQLLPMSHPMTLRSRRRTRPQQHEVQARNRRQQQPFQSLHPFVSYPRLCPSRKRPSRPPQSLDQVPGATLKQMSAYAYALATIYPGRRISAALLYTHTPQLIALPEEFLNEGEDGLVGNVFASGWHIWLDRRDGSEVVLSGRSAEVQVAQIGERLDQVSRDEDQTWSGRLIQCRDHLGGGFHQGGSQRVQRAQYDGAHRQNVGDAVSEVLVGLGGQKRETGAAGAGDATQRGCDRPSKGALGDVGKGQYGGYRIHRRIGP